MAAHAAERTEPLPAWSLPAGAVEGIALARRVAASASPASGRWGGSTGAGRPRLHPRQRRRGGPPAGRARSQRRSPSLVGPTDEIVDRGRRRGRPLRPRHGLRRHRPRRSRPTASSTACACSAPATRAAAPSARRAALGDRAGLRRRQHEPLDDEAAARRDPARARRHRLLPQDVLVASAHNMPVESYPWRFASVVSVGQPRASRPARLLLQPRAAGRVLRPRRRRRRRLARRRHAALHRQQLRDAAHDRHLRAHPRQAPGADAVPAQERALPDGRRT